MGFKQGRKASGVPEQIFKTLFLVVFLYTGFLFYREGSYILSTLVFSLLFAVIWVLLDSEIF